MSLFVYDLLSLVSKKGSLHHLALQTFDMQVNFFHKFHSFAKVTRTEHHIFWKQERTFLFFCLLVFFILSFFFFHSKAFSFEDAATKVLKFDGLCCFRELQLLLSKFKTTQWIWELLIIHLLSRLLCCLTCFVHDVHLQISLDLCIFMHQF